MYILYMFTIAITLIVVCICFHKYWVDPTFMELLVRSFYNSPSDSHWKAIWAACATVIAQNYMHSDNLMF